MSSGQGFALAKSRKMALIRTVMIGCLTVTLAATLVVSSSMQSAYAAPTTATVSRQDRRPDRERSITTSQGSTNSGSSHGSPSTGSRPRLVRR